MAFTRFSFTQTNNFCWGTGCKYIQTKMNEKNFQINKAKTSNWLTATLICTVKTS